MDAIASLGRSHPNRRRTTSGRHLITPATALEFIRSMVICIAVWSAVGFVVVHRLPGLVRLDDDISRWMVRQQSDLWDTVSLIGSDLADVKVKIPGILILSAFFLLRWRRWKEVALLVGAMIFEVGVFTMTSWIVDRPRPPIRHMDPIPPTSTFPSGHSAAAVAFYGAIAIIVFWHARSRTGRALAVLAAVVIPIVVAVARVYRGMHHVSDVIAGLVLGAVALAIVYSLVSGRGLRVPLATPHRGRRTRTMDVTKLLESDHRQVEELFGRIERAKGADRQPFVDELASSLRSHMQLEEDVLYPRMGRATGDEKVEEGRVEHELARKALEDVVRLAPDQPGMGAALEALKGGIGHHVEEEEEEMFPKIRKERGLLEELATPFMERRVALGLPTDSGALMAASSKQELRSEADAAHVEGAASMSKQELADALAERLSV